MGLIFSTSLTLRPTMGMTYLGVCVFEQWVLEKKRERTKFKTQHHHRGRCLDFLLSMRHPLLRFAFALAFMSPRHSRSQYSTQPCYLVEALRFSVQSYQTHSTFSAITMQMTAARPPIFVGLPLPSLLQIERYLDFKLSHSLSFVELSFGKQRVYIGEHTQRHGALPILYYQHPLYLRLTGHYGRIFTNSPCASYDLTKVRTRLLTGRFYIKRFVWRALHVHGLAAESNAFDVVCFTLLKKSEKTPLRICDLSGVHPSCRQSPLDPVELIRHNIHLLLWPWSHRYMASLSLILAVFDLFFFLNIRLLRFLTQHWVCSVKSSEMSDASLVLYVMVSCRRLESTYLATKDDWRHD